MRVLRQTTLNVALALAPMMGTGCVSSSPKVTYSRTMQQRDLKMNTARLEESRGNLELSKRLYEEIYLQNPSDPECLHRLAIVSTRLNQHNEAEAYYQQANQLSPNNPELLADMGYAAFMRKDYEQSETLLEQSVQLRGTDRRTITNLAIVLAWRVKDESSLEKFRQVGSESESLRNLAAIQIARGDKDKGLKGYELAKSFDSQKPTTENVIAQTAASDAAYQAIDVPPLPVDLPPSPTTPVFKALGAAQLPATLLLPSQMLSQSGQIVTQLSQTVTELIPPASMDNPASCTRVAPPEQMIDMPPPPPFPPGSAPPTSAPIPPVTESPDQYDPPAQKKNRVPAPVNGTDTTQVRQSDVTTAVRFPSESDRDQLSIPIDVDVVCEPFVAPSPVKDDAIQANLLANEAPAVGSQQDLSIRTTSVWRRTPASRGGPSEEIAATSDVESLPLAPHAAARAEDKSSVWSICLVTLLEEKRLAPARAEFSMEYQSQKYRFASAEALEKFRASPEKYAPVAGGLDIVSVRNERSVVEGSLNFALWYRKQLYLFSSRAHAESFRREPQKYAATH